MSEYKDALSIFNKCVDFELGGVSNIVGIVDTSVIESVRRALLIADALEKEPSYEMTVSGAAAFPPSYGNVFKSMVAKLKEEIGIDDKNAS